MYDNDDLTGDRLTSNPYYIHSDNEFVSHLYGSTEPIAHQTSTQSIESLRSVPASATSPALLKNMPAMPNLPNIEHFGSKNSNTNTSVTISNTQQNVIIAGFLVILVICILCLIGLNNMSHKLDMVLMLINSRGLNSMGLNSMGPYGFPQVQPLTS